MSIENLMPFKASDARRLIPDEYSRASKHLYFLTNAIKSVALKGESQLRCSVFPDDVLEVMLTALLAAGYRVYHTEAGLIVDWSEDVGDSSEIMVNG